MSEEIKRTPFTEETQKNRAKITAMISTKGRHDTTLPMAMVAICNQTRVPDNLIIYDDEDEYQDLRKVDPKYDHLFCLVQQKGMSWIYEAGCHKGQHHNHQRNQDRKECHDLIWRVDDDLIPDPNVLEILERHFEDPKVGAVGGLILSPNKDITKEPVLISGGLEDIDCSANLQWFRHKENISKEVDHLHCSFMYRKGIAKYNLNLSPVAHREETMFSYEIKLAGYKVLVDPRVESWHLRYPSGGIRSHPHPEWFAEDDKIFKKKLEEWKIPQPNFRIIVLDSGIGDHLTFKKYALSDLKKKYDSKLILAVCFNEVFEHEGVKLISIADAHQLVDVEAHNVYGWMWRNKWKGSLGDAYKSMYSS